MEKSPLSTEATSTKARSTRAPFSRHVFLFPFKWEYYEGDKDTKLATRSAIEKFIEFLQPVSGPAIIENRWNKNPFQLNTTLRYNEYNYFYDFTREVMWDVDEPLRSLTTQQDKILYHFEYCLSPEARYIIEINKKRNPDQSEKTTTYALNIDSVILNVYTTGVAILSFHLINDQYENLQSILDINKFGRRVYVPFFTGVENNFDLEGTSKVELPLRIAIKGTDINYEENFEDYKDYNNFTREPFRLPAFIKKLFTKSFRTKNDSEEKTLSPYILISPVQDDRMFVVSWFSNPEFSRKIELTKQDYTNDKDWYKYLFVDSDGPGCGNDQLLSKLIKQHTYDRWLNYGTLYGICRYAFVCLESGAFVRDHMVGMYYKMTELALVQRASMLKFSDEVTRISQLGKKEENDKKLTGEIRELYAAYIRFVNKIYFREVTAQEQGIELYDLIQNRLRLKEHIKDLDQEIEELHNYAAMLEDKMKGEREEKRNDRLELLTIVGFLFLIPSFITGYYGMNIFNDRLEPYSQTHLTVIGGLILLATFVIFRSTRHLHSKSKSVGVHKGLIGFGLAIVLFMMFYPVFNQRPNEQMQESTLEISQPTEIIIEIDSTRLTIPTNNLEFKVKKETNEK